VTNIVVIIIAFARVYTWIIFISVILSWFIRDPYHPLRQGVDNLVRPLLDPIRRILPSTGMLDFSPFVLLILIQLATNLLISIFQ